MTRIGSGVTIPKGLFTLYLNVKKDKEMKHLFLFKYLAKSKDKMNEV
jgi:hypothetical protein